MTLGKLALLFTFYSALIGYALHAFYWTPSPQPADVPASQFSEARARQHVSVLTEQIGVRSVGDLDGLPLLLVLKTLSMPDHWQRLQLQHQGTSVSSSSSWAARQLISEELCQRYKHTWCIVCVAYVQVSTPGLQAAHHYIWGLTQQLQAAGEQRGDVIVQTAFENYTGSTDFDFVVRGSEAAARAARCQPGSSCCSA